MDPFQLNLEALESGDLEIPEAFRKYAQYWLVGDELRAGRALGRRDRAARVEILTRVEELYGSAAGREDVENIELQVLDNTYVTPFLSTGLQVHMPYTAYAHWFLVHRILTGAGVEQVQFNSDIDSMNRAAFLSAFAEEVKRGDAHASSSTTPSSRRSMSVSDPQGVKAAHDRVSRSLSRTRRLDRETARAGDNEGSP